MRRVISSSFCGDDMSFVYTDAEIWNACANILRDEKRPLEVWRVARAAMTGEDRIILALMRETLVRREDVTFRYPPIPCAAIIAVGDVGKPGVKQVVAAPDRFLEEYEPCDHTGCLSHVTHPCDSCGRIGGRGCYDPENQLKKAV